MEGIYTDNNFYIRNVLSDLGYPCLSFFTQGDFIRVEVCKRANAKQEWIEKYSSAFNNSNGELMGRKYLSNNDFINFISMRQKDLDALGR